MTMTHTRFQSYHKHYGMVCITGMFGGRWHRYQQSKDNTKKIDLVWFAFLVVTYLFVTMWFYFWLVAKNDSDDINWFIYQSTGNDIQWYKIILALASTTFIYAVGMMILALCHIGHGHEIHMHILHRCMLVLTVAGCVATIFAIGEVWSPGWYLMNISLGITAPFLQIGAVVLMTALTWLIAAKWMKLEKTGVKIVTLGIFLSVMIFLYLIPLLLHSPCITEEYNLPPRPSVLAHRGASAIAPENTVIAFKYALDKNPKGVESDVRVSADGIPFLLHDDDLIRTTNVKEVFPKLADQEAKKFNMSQLQQLDAGSWFLQKNPFGTTSSLTEAQRKLYKNQTIPTFAEVLEIVKEKNKSILFDLKFLNYKDPKSVEDLNTVIKVIQDSGIDPNLVFWLDYRSSNRTNFFKIAPSSDLEAVLERNYTYININYEHFSIKSLKSFQRYNVSTNIYTINSKWLYSYFWCAGVESVTSTFVHSISDLHSPVWHIEPTTYLVIWIVTDSVSAFLIVVIFIIQKIRHSGSQFNPERVSFQVAKDKITQVKKSRNMREKLLVTAEGLQEVEPGVSGIESPPTPSMAHEDFSQVSSNGDMMCGNSFRSSVSEDFSNMSGISNGGAGDTIKMAEVKVELA